MNIIYEHHPEKMIKQKNTPATLKQIVESAEPFFEYGAFSRLLIMKKLNFMKSQMVLTGVLEHFGKNKVAFEILSSSKEAEVRWYSDILIIYFELFGNDCNSN